MTASNVIRVDAWEMRCRFNKARYWERAQRGELDAVLDRRNPATTGGPPNSIQEQWFIYEPNNGPQLARISRFLDQDGNEIRSADPKDLVVDGIRYRQHSGQDRRKREPEYRYKYVWQRKLYGFWRRRVKCPLLGR